jgi:preprotein translocase SecE subunit
VARNRKRAKERRARQPQPVPGVRQEPDDDEAPSPLAHAMPDVELAEAQLALGRPELAGPAAGGEYDGDEYEEEHQQAPDIEEIDSASGGRGGGYVPPVAGDLVPGGAHVPEPRARPGTRLLTFIQGSWRELQRVQWPDRRQVMQATGVVVGFVIVAGVWLAVADTFAGHLMNYILTGKW